MMAFTGRVIILFLLLICTQDICQASGHVTQVEEGGSCGSPAVQPSVISRISGGEEAIPHSWPWQVTFYQGPGYGYSCGGSLISPRWIVTAAHCTLRFDDPVIRAYLGVHNTGSMEKGVVKARIERYFNQEFDGRDNDIALVKLDREVPYSDTISPVCLPRPGEDVLPESNCVTTGWGKLSFGGVHSEVLKQLIVPVANRADCNHTSDFYDGQVTENMICAGYEDGRASSCPGDSGGPLVCAEEGRWVLQGVVSWGEMCSSWTLYSRVSMYIDWIENIMAENA